jgi:ribose 5-phosphate isomerase B
MKVYLGTDHTGFEIKNKIKAYLEDKGHEVIDCGAHEYDKDDDYPDFIGKAAEGVSGDTGSMGIVFGGSGQGEAMVANKYKGVRCALFYSPAVAPGVIDVGGGVSTDPFEMLRLTRAHNNSNVLSIGVRFLIEEQIIQAVDTFLDAPFTKEERHVRRIDKISQIEHDLR